MRDRGSSWSNNSTAFLDPSGRFVQVCGLQRIREIDQIPWPIWPEGYLERFWQGWEILRRANCWRHANNGFVRLPLPMHLLLQPDDVDDTLYSARY